MTNINSVIFDLGGVILEWNPRAVVDGFTSDPGERELLYSEIFQHPDWLEMDCGRSSETEVMRRVSSRTNLPTDRIESLLSQTKDSLVLIPESYELLSAAKQSGMDLYCLSNMSVETYEHMKLMHGFFDMFDGIVISGLVKMMKPDPEIFKFIIDQYNLCANETLFVDDNSANVNEATRHGIKAVRFENTPDCFAKIRSFWLE